MSPAEGMTSSAGDGSPGVVTIGYTAPTTAGGLYLRGTRSTWLPLSAALAAGPDETTPATIPPELLSQLGLGG